MRSEILSFSDRLPLASLSITGPPGYSSPSIFPTLSNASPAASSRVRRNDLIFSGFGNKKQICMSARNDQSECRDIRPADFQMRPNRHVLRCDLRRQTECPNPTREPLRNKRRPASEPIKTGTLRNSDRLDFFERNICLFQRFINDRIDLFEMILRRQVPARLRRKVCAVRSAKK